MRPLYPQPLTSLNIRAHIIKETVSLYFLFRIHITPASLAKRILILFDTWGILTIPLGSISNLSNTPKHSRGRFKITILLLNRPPVPFHLLPISCLTPESRIDPATWSEFQWAPMMSMVTKGRLWRKASHGDAWVAPGESFPPPLSHSLSSCSLWHTWGAHSQRCPQRSRLEDL